MFKKLVLIAVVLTALLATATPAFAARGTYYVDTNYTGTEMGTMAQPYKTFDKAIATAQANPDGGYIYTGTAGSNNWKYLTFIPGVNSPIGGASLSRTALLVLLGLASLILVATGWFLRRRSHNLPNRA
jgi:hypothetical protein